MKRSILGLLIIMMGIVYITCGQSTGNYTSPTIGTLKHVPAGRFQRDDDPENISVISQPYRMSQHEITRAQFRSIMGEDPSDTNYSSGTNDPVQMVNWYHAIAFCNKLSLAEDLTPVYTVSGVNFASLTFAQIPLNFSTTWNAATANWAANGYRLPTEMEWMWAAMGAPADGQGDGTNRTGYLKDFSGSTGNNNMDDYVWYFRNSGDRYLLGEGDWNTIEANKGRTRPAGTKRANELGLYDMSGNVWEWCWDWYSSYPAGTKTDYRGTDSGTVRVGRGGSWEGNASYCAVSDRYYGIPSGRGIMVGFRVVCP